MSLEGIITLVGIIIAIYALAQPIQQRSIPLFIPTWLMVLPLMFSASILLVRFAINLFHYKFVPWLDLLLTLAALFIPVIGAWRAIYLWKKATLSENKDQKFRDFINAGYYENRYDELVRIINKNIDRLPTVLAQDTLELLFDKSFIQHAIRSRTWLHLILLANEKVIQKLPNRYWASDNLIRILVAEPDSILYTAIAHDIGGEEFRRLTENESNILGKTFWNPNWYMGVRADYPLMLNASEVLSSGALDIPYNKNDDLYIARQGKSTRIKCPLYIALKTHLQMIKQAIKLSNNKDYYISNLSQLAHLVYEHSRYNQDVWENIDANREYPTPFVFLLKEISTDLQGLCEDCYNLGGSPPKRIGTELVMAWSFCIRWPEYGVCKISQKLKAELLGKYIDYILQLRNAHNEESINIERKANISLWSELFLSKLKDRYRDRDKEKVKEFLQFAINELDHEKLYVSRNLEWIRRELSLSYTNNG